MSEAAIRVRDLTKRYRRSSAGFRFRTLKSTLLSGSLVSDIAPEDTIEALHEVSLEVEQGGAVGLIGANGSGKSTLLKIVAGLLQPTSGSIEVRGRVAALIELGAGFHPEISGRENVYINGAVLGLSKRQIDRRYEHIVEFSGLEDFMEEPVKHYSSGMFVRLGFSVAVHTDPEILLVDEVLSVGDEAFSHRCIRRIQEFLGGGGTLLLVSHDMALVEDLCDRAMWLDRGVPKSVGPPRQVVDAYRQAVAETEAEEHLHRLEEDQVLRTEEEQPLAAEQPSAEDSSVEEPAVEEPAVEEPAVEKTADEPPSEPRFEEVGELLRWGSGAAEIRSVRLLDGAGRESYHVRSGDPVTFEIKACSRQALDNVVFGIGIATPRGVEVWGTNSDMGGITCDTFDGRCTVRLSCRALRLAPGEYVVDAAVHSREGAPYDYRRKVFGFSVTASDRGVGVYFPQHRWSSTGDIRWLEPSSGPPDATE